MATLASLIWTPRSYLVGDDFALWIDWFEAYTHTVRIPDDKLSDACWTMAVFRVFDLLGLPEETVKDYKCVRKLQIVPLHSFGAREEL